MGAFIERVYSWCYFQNCAIPETFKMAGKKVPVIKVKYLCCLYLYIHRIHSIYGFLLVLQFLSPRPQTVCISKKKPVITEASMYNNNKNRSAKLFEFAI